MRFRVFFLVACVLLFVVAGLVNVAVALNVGYAVVGDYQVAPADILTCSPIDVVVSSGYGAHLKEFWIYSNGSGLVGGAVYDSNWVKVKSFADIIVTSEIPAWYSEGVDLVLPNGSYWLVGRFTYNVNGIYTDTVGVGDGYYEYSSTYPVSLSTSTTGTWNRISMFVVYDVVDLVQVTSPFYAVILFVLVLLDLVVLLGGFGWLVGLVFGLGGLVVGVGSFGFQSLIPFSPFPQVLLGVVSLVVLLRLLAVRRGWV